MQLLSRYFMPSSITETQKHKATLTMMFCSILTPAAGIYAFLYYFFGATDSAIACLLVGVHFAISLAILKSGAVSLAATSAASALFWIQAYLLIKNGGVYSGSTPWLLVVPAVAILLCGLKEGVIWGN